MAITVVGEKYLASSLHWRETLRREVPAGPESA
jgi:hypothetical protein